MKHADARGAIACSAAVAKCFGSDFRVKDFDTACGFIDQLETMGQERRPPAP